MIDSFFWPYRFKAQLHPSTSSRVRETLIKAGSTASWSFSRLFEPLFPHLSSERLRKRASKIHRTDIPRSAAHRLRSLASEHPLADDHCLRFRQASFNQCFSRAVLVTFAIIRLSAPQPIVAAEFAPINDANFGTAVSISGSTGLVGAYGATINGNQYSQGAAYVLRNLDSGAGQEVIGFTAGDGKAYDQFGNSVSVSGGSALVGANGYNANAVYWFRNLDSGTIEKVVKLIDPDGSETQFGSAVSLSGSIGLVGAQQATVNGRQFQGAAYVYRNPDASTTAPTAKLVASNGAAWNFFGTALSISGEAALVGASNKAYLFTNLDTATGTVTEFAKLAPSIANRGAAYDDFGGSLSISGSTGLVGNNYAKVGSNDHQGAVYLYRNLGTQAGTIYESAKLTASDGAAENYFGSSVSLSGNTGLVGAGNARVGSNNEQGATYLFLNLDTAPAAATESVKLTASTGGTREQFGRSVSLSGDNFLIGSLGNSMASISGKAYSGSVSSVSTLNAGNASRVIDGISFESRIDWIIGETTSFNKVTLKIGNAANVTASGKAVYIGAGAGSSHNTLVIEGALAANAVYIGSLSGNEGNTLTLENTATLTPTSLFLAPGNSLSVEGAHTDLASLLAFLGGSTDVKAWDGGSWISINEINYGNFISYSTMDGYSNFQALAIPEPGSIALIGMTGLSLGVLRRFGRNSSRSPGKRCQV